MGLSSRNRDTKCDYVIDRVNDLVKASRVRVLNFILKKTQAADYLREKACGTELRMSRLSDEEINDLYDLTKKLIRKQKGELRALIAARN